MSALDDLSDFDLLLSWEPFEVPVQEAEEPEFLLDPEPPEIGSEPATEATSRLRSRAGRAAVTRELAAIIETFDTPYASQNERYVVTVDECAGEVFELGRPYRSTRFFPRHALKRNVDAYRSFMAFAQGQDTTDWRFWNVGIPDHKAPIHCLSSELKRFNKAINQEFSHLRKLKAMEVLLTGIHIRYDYNTDSFDLHAHIICRVNKEKHDLASSHLFRKFSKIEANNEPIFNIESAVTYLLWGILDPEAMLDWPEAAVRAAWDVTTAKMRLMRTGGDFALWRRAQRAVTADPAAQDARRRKARNRAETAYAPARLPSGDKVLGRMRMTLGGSLREGVLLERASLTAPAETAPTTTNISPLRDTGYPSATVATTQESPETLPPPLATPRLVRSRRPQAWWWRAWPYRRPSTSTASGSFSGLPRPLQRRLATCSPGSLCRPPGRTFPGGARPDLNSV